MKHPLTRSRRQATTIWYGCSDLRGLCRSETRTRQVVPSQNRLLAVGHRPEELAVALGLRHLREQQLHAFDGGERREDFAQHPHAVEIFLGDEQLLFPRAALLDVDRGEHAAIG